MMQRWLLFECLIEGWSWFCSRLMSYFLFYQTFSILENFNTTAGGSLDQNCAYLQRAWKGREQNCQPPFCWFVLVCFGGSFVVLQGFFKIVLEIIHVISFVQCSRSIMVAFETKRPEQTDASRRGSVCVLLFSLLLFHRNTWLYYSHIGPESLWKQQLFKT